MSTPVDPRGVLADHDRIARDQLSSLQGLLVLSMLMTESGQVDQIVHLAATTVPSLGSSRLEGVYIVDLGWRATAVSFDATAQADVASQFPVLQPAGGAVAIVGKQWAWAFPLRSLGGPLGHLVVAAEREPAHREVFLLRVLAQQAGIALANARLHERERDAAHQLRLANTRLAATVATIERSSAIHERLTRVAVAGEGLQGLAEALHELTRATVTIEDRFGNLRSWAGAPGTPAPVKDGAQERAEALARAIEHGGPIRYQQGLLAVATPQAGVLGVVRLRDLGADIPGDVQVALEHGTTVLAMELARLQSVAETELRFGRDLVDEVLSGTGDEQVLAHARALGYDLEQPHRVVLVERADPDLATEVLFDAVRRASRDSGTGTLLLAREDRIVVLAPRDGPWDRLVEAMAEQLGGHRCRIGVGAGAARPSDLPRSHHQAQLALKVAGSIGERGLDRAIEYERLGIYRFLAEMEDLGEVDRFVREMIGTLLDYDDGKGAELVETLAAYLRCGGGYEATSAALSVHRSTLKYRLQRIREISGHDLNDPDTAFNLQLATRAHRARTSLTAST